MSGSGNLRPRTTLRERLKSPAGRVALAFLVLVGVSLLYLAIAPWFEIGGVVAPAVSAVVPVRLDQGWDEATSIKYHHTSQGTRVLPRDWFFALEQPVLTPFAVNRLAEPDYLGRFGFVYDDAQPSAGEDVLPVGFAIEEAFHAPYAVPPVSRPTRMVGLTCAACHTGRLDIRLDDGTTKGVLIDGGSAMINLASFQDATGRALFYTTIFPQRFNRFARSVLKADKPTGDPDKEALRLEVLQYVATGLISQDYARDHKLVPVAGGFSRTDALGLIGNRVFGVMSEENQVVTDAPVNFPHLWDTPWFDWVQYNASIRTPLARNVGEALGVGAAVNLDPRKDTLYKTTVNVPNLIWMEELVGGFEPFGGLRPPRWSDMVARVFGAAEKAPAEYRVDPSLAAEGRALYHTLCAGCHLPPRDELETALASKQDLSAWFTDPDAVSGKRFLKLPVIDLNVIGTDPNQALNFHRRVAVSPFPKETGAPGLNWSETISAEVGLFRITSQIRLGALRAAGLLAPLSETDPARRKAFNDEPKRQAARLSWDRYRSVAPQIDVGEGNAVNRGVGLAGVIAANLGYKARPLDGVWATPPYLHNGSVASLDQVLLPVAKRDARLSLGARRFDPKVVGYFPDRPRGGSDTDTSKAGNHNTGHEYRDLTLEELERASSSSRPLFQDREARWARVLGVTPTALAALSKQERQRAHHEATVKGLDALPLKGVLGAELSADQRRRLVEFLKTQ